jgi:hypothetical protein
MQSDHVPLLREGNEKFKYFSGCVGAFDGSHIPVVVSAEEAVNFRNRKQWTSQNVLFAVNHDMAFTYCLAGGEGCAHDATILNRATDLSLPPMSFYIADAGYALSHRVLTPYRGVRYHLREWYPRLRPRNYKELFNLRHAQLRNIIERAFGVLKKRFAVLRSSMDMSIDDQTATVYCAVAVHNFIRVNDRQEHDRLVQEEANEAAAAMAKQAAASEMAFRVKSASFIDDFEDVGDNETELPNDQGAAAWRKFIAKAMWVEYVEYLRLRGRSPATSEIPILERGNPFVNQCSSANC